MADPDRQWQRSALHVLKGIWGGISGFIADLRTPFEIQVHDDRHFDSSNSTNMPVSLSRNVNLCHKWCAGCCLMRPLDEFFSAFQSQEWNRCYYCRSQGDFGHLEGYELKDRLLPAPKTVSQYCKRQYHKQKKKLDFYDIALEEKEANGDLTAGEKFITWERLGRLMKKRRKEAKTMKGIRRKRRKRRKGKSPTWRYPWQPTSRYEAGMRKRYEDLWRKGFDECLPQSLSKDNSWISFWNRHKLTDVYEDNIRKEREKDAKDAANRKNWGLPNKIPTGSIR